MKTELKKLKVKFEGKLIEIDIQKELLESLQELEK